MLFLQVPQLLFLLLVVPAVPSPAPRQGRSWEEEACSAGRLREQARYVCSSEGKIQCLEGWIGDLCQVAVCGPECDPQHGYCLAPGECECNLGYTGPGCRDCVPLPGCLHGHCSKGFECRCEPGWSGMFCNQPECEGQCELQGGVCVAPGQCECGEGLTGPDCSQCSTRPGCLHGSCEKPLDCNCEPGWEGPLCDSPVCAETCSVKHGTCSQVTSIQKPLTSPKLCTYFQPGECLCELGYQGDSCHACLPYPGCVNGDCDQPYDCNCRPGWTGHLCDVPETEVFGPGQREGRCQPVGAFLCLHGGEDICRYYGNGTRIGEPLCDCKPGFWGRWCETDATSSHSYIRLEGVEPRHSVSQSVSSVQSSVSDDHHHDNDNDQNSDNDSTSATATSQGTSQETTFNKKLDDEDFHELIHEEFGIRAIHSDIFNSGKRVESLGSREGLQ